MSWIVRYPKIANRHCPRWLPCLVLIAGVALVHPVSAASRPASGPDSGSTGLESAAVYLPIVLGKRIFDVTPFLGTYEGTWTNEAAGTEGPARIELDADTTAKTANLTIDFDGNYLGLGDPPPQTLSGVFDEDGALVQGVSPLFGNYKVTIDPLGNILGRFENLAGGAIPEMTYTAKITADRLDADYTVRFADGRTTTSLLRTQRLPDIR